MDPAGILMLRSVRIFFELMGMEPESINFIKEKFNAQNIVKCLTDSPRKCPVIVTCDINVPPGDRSSHIMVTSNALKGDEFIKGPNHPEVVHGFENAHPYYQHLKDQWFINCKNSYRDETSQPGMIDIY